MKKLVESVEKDILYFRHRSIHLEAVKIKDIIARNTAEIDRRLYYVRFHRS